MATESIRVSGIIPASPKVVYDAWLDSKEHARFTGAPASVEPRVGGKMTARNDYIQGEILELQPGKRIVQSWRSTDFPKNAPDSRVEVIVRAHVLGTELTFLHDGIPEGQAHLYEAGWLDQYVTRMRRYFGSRAQAASTAAAKRSVAAAAEPAPKPAAKAKPAAKDAGEKAKPKPKAVSGARASTKAKAPRPSRAPARPKKVAARKAKTKRPTAKKPAKKRAAAKKSKTAPSKKRSGKKTKAR